MAQKSLLNPNAVPYIPLSKISAVKSLKDKNVVTEPVLVVDQDFGTVDPVCGQYNIYNFEEPNLSEESSSEFSSKFNQVEDTLVMDNYDYLDPDRNIMEILSSRHPDFSVDSLVDVFNANDGDLDATINALDQLEEDYDSAEDFSEGLDLGADTFPGFEKSSSSGTSSHPEFPV